MLSNAAVWTLALQGKLDPVVGRKKQIERVIQILGRRTKNNPCLIGEPVSAVVGTCGLEWERV